MEPQKEQKRFQNRPKNMSENKVPRRFKAEVDGRSADVSDSRVGGSGGAGVAKLKREFTEFYGEIYQEFTDEGFHTPCTQRVRRMTESALKSD